MKAALRGNYLDIVFYMGSNERYPWWFSEELYDAIFTDESRYTFWVDRHSRRPDYYEKELVEDYSVFLKKSNGTIFVSNYDQIEEMYTIFRSDKFTNSGLVAFNEDVIDYVECHGGNMLYAMEDDWFYEYITEVINHPQEEETIFFTHDANGISVTQHCAVLSNKYGEIKVMDWRTFLKHYDPDPGI